MLRTRNIHRSAIELWVEAYLKRLEKTNNIRKERKFIQKAITLIELELNDPCCVDPTAVTSLTTYRDNQLLNFLKPILEHVDRRSNRKSLVRTQEMLRDVLTRCCTSDVVISYATSVDAKITFYNNLTKKLYTLPTLNGGGTPHTYTITLPNIGTYNVSLQQLNVGAGVSLASAHVSITSAGVVGIYTQNGVVLDTAYTLS